MLKRLVGRIMSQQLDRTRPLWEMWFVEGLEDDQFALISKTHHCMIDGVSGADLISVIMEPFPNPEPGEPTAVDAAPAPERRAPAVRRGAAARRRSRSTSCAPPPPPSATPSRRSPRWRRASSALAEAFSPTLKPASLLPINSEVGPSRRFDWTAMSVADFKAVKNVLGGTLNDVVLATVSGALRRFCLQRAVDPDTLHVRALVPVSVRGAGGARPARQPRHRDHRAAARSTSTIRSRASRRCASPWAA